MGKRADLHQLLENIMPVGSENVYYQPPESKKMNYPAIVYELSRIDNKNANDNVYSQSIGYMLTVIDKNPDSEIVNEVSKLPKCRFDRHFVSSNLNHTIFTIFY